MATTEPVDSARVRILLISLASRIVAPAASRRRSAPRPIIPRQTTPSAGAAITPSTGLPSQLFMERLFHRWVLLAVDRDQSVEGRVAPPLGQVAMDNRDFNVLAYPMGRLIGERPGYPIELEKMRRAAKEGKCFVEVNSHPSRLDFDDGVCRLTKELGVAEGNRRALGQQLAVHALWHRPVAALARGVLNTRPLRELEKLFKRR